MENLIENLMPSQLIGIDLDVLLQNMTFLVKSHVNEEKTIKIFELKIIKMKDLSLNIQNFKALRFCKIDFLKVRKDNKLYYIHIQMSENPIDIRIISEKLEWNSLIEESIEEAFSKIPMY